MADTDRKMYLQGNGNDAQPLKERSISLGLELFLTILVMPF